MTWANRFLGVAAATAFLAMVAPSTAHAAAVLTGHEHGRPTLAAGRPAPKANPLKPNQQLGRRPAFAAGRPAPKTNPLKPNQQLGRRPAFA
jgi:hypothetical protein